MIVKPGLMSISQNSRASAYCGDVCGGSVPDIGIGVYGTPTVFHHVPSI